MKYFFLLSMIIYSTSYSMESASQTAAFLGNFARLTKAIHANADEVTKPCTPEICAQYLALFEKEGCDWLCRKEYLDKLAENFDLKKDGKFLRALICANKTHFLYRHQGQMVQVHRRVPLKQLYLEDEFGRKIYDDSAAYHRTTRIDFIDTAVRKNNVAFMKLFFSLFSPEDFAFETDHKKTELLAVNAGDALAASAKMTQLVYENAEFDGTRFAYPCAKKFLGITVWQTPGCEFFNARVQETKAARAQQQKDREVQKQKWYQNLRDTVTSAKI